MDISIVIATKDRENTLRNCINSIIDQSKLPNEVIIIDASDNNLTKELISDVRNKENKIKWIYKHSDPGLTKQRNLSFKFINGDIVGFLDDDVILEADYIEQIITVFEKYDIIGSCGKDMLEVNTSLLSNIYAKLFFLQQPTELGEVKSSGAACRVSPQVSEIISVQWLPGYNMFFDYLQINSIEFDDHLIKYSYLEDLDFSFRIGNRGKLLFNPNAKLQHMKEISSDTRLNKIMKRFMFTINYHYIFRKNYHLGKFNFITHIISLIGLPFRYLISDKSFFSFIGVCLGWFEILRNVKYPQNLPKTFNDYFE